MTYTRAGRCEEDERAKISSALVAQSTGSIDESGNTVCLDARADD